MENGKAKGGRPKKLDTRNHVINVRFDELELATLERTAKAYETSKSELIRSAVLGLNLPAPIPTLNQEQWLLLGSVSNNLNQSVKAMNELIKTGKLTTEKFQSFIDDIKTTIKTVGRLRNEVIGRS